MKNKHIFAIVIAQYEHLFPTNKPHVNFYKFTFLFLQIKSEQAMINVNIDPNEQATKPTHKKINYIYSLITDESSVTQCLLI